MKAGGIRAILCSLTIGLALTASVWAETRGVTVTPGTAKPPASLAAPAPAAPGASAALDPVHGQGCYTFGDDQTPAQAKKAALALARQQAVEGYRVYVQSASTVKNFQLEDDLIQNVSAGMLQDVQVEKTEKKDQEICITIAARISPVKLEELIQQRAKAKDVAQTAQAPLLTAGSAFGLRLWTNKPDGSFVEGDPLIVSLQSDRDGYLKLDYFQADGTVVHLVPNVFGGEAFIRAGQTYTFGGPGGREAFTIQGPFGSETIKALVSSQPFDRSLAAANPVEESRGYLNNLQVATRGIKVGAGAAAAPPQWSEAALGLITNSKTVVDYDAALPRVRGLRKLSSPPPPAKPVSTTGTVGQRPSDQDQPRP